MTSSCDICCRPKFRGTNDVMRDFISEAMNRDLEMLKRVGSTSVESPDFSLNKKKMLKYVLMI